MPLKKVFFILLISLSGCKVFEPQEMPATAKLPSTFIGSQDTVSLGYTPRKFFFTDSILVNYLELAVKNNLDLSLATQRIEIARTQVLLSKGALLPSVIPEAVAGMRKFGKYTMDGVGNFDSNLSENVVGDRRIPDPLYQDYFLGFRSSWEIDVWGKLKNQKKAAHARLLASEKGRQAMTTSVVAEVAKLYYQLLALDNELEIIRKNISLQEIAVETINILKEGGRVNELAVRQFKAQLLRTKSLEAEIQLKIRNTENLLNFLLGRFPQSLQRGTSLLNQQVPRDIKTGIPSQMLLRRPDIRQAELELLAAKADLQSARAAFLPSFNISSFIGLNAFKSNLLFTSPGSIAYGALGGLSAPLFQKNQIRSNYRRSQAENLQAHYAYQKLLINGYQEVSTSLSRIENYQKVWDLKTEEVATFNQAVSISNDLFIGGYASYLEVIMAQRSVLEAELGMITAKQNQFFSLIDLYRALGGGWENN